MELEIKIKHILEKKGKTIKWLALEIDMSEQNLYKIFKRNSIETSHLEKISEVLEVPIDYFFDSSEKNYGDVIINSKNSKIKSDNNNVNSLNKELLNQENEMLNMKIEALEREIESLKENIKMKDELVKSRDEQIKSKEEVIKTKEEIIDFLKSKN
jgi:DNA-binding Xre family transcriptional regulator